jgi:hypothetical protein
MRMQPKKNCQARNLLVSVPQEKECPEGRGAKKLRGAENVTKSNDDIFILFEMKCNE